MGMSAKRALLAALGGLGDSQKFIGLQAGTTDQGAVDVARRQQFTGVARLYRPAIEQAHGAGIG